MKLTKTELAQITLLVTYAKKNIVPEEDWGIVDTILEKLEKISE